MNILLVDNDKNIIKTLKTFLNSKKYEVDVAYNGKEALKKIKINGSYDVLILDVMMPKVNGIDVCRSINKGEDLKKIPVLLISSLPIASRDFQDSFRNFAEFDLVKAVLEKPFSPQDLLVRIQNISKQS